MTNTRRRSIASVAAAAGKPAGGPAHTAAAAPHRPNMAYAQKFLAKLNAPQLPAHAIRIEGDIDDRMVASVRDQIRTLPANTRRVLIALDSRGGFLHHERQIADALAALERPIDGHVIRLAGSAAALLLAKCEYRTAAPGATVLFHLAGFQQRAKERLTAANLRAMLANLETADKQIVDKILRGRLGLSNAALAEILAGRDWETTAANALRMGILHRVTNTPTPPPAGWYPEPALVPELKDRNKKAAAAARNKAEAERKQRLQPFSPRHLRRRR